MQLAGMGRDVWNEHQNLDALLFILQSVVHAQDEDKKVIEKIYWAFKKRGILPMLKKSSRSRYKYALEYLGLSSQGVAADSSAPHHFVVNEAFCKPVSWFYRAICKIKKEIPSVWYLLFLFIAMIDQVRISRRMWRQP